MHTVVERELELNLVLSPERSISVPARLVYRTDDPFAVQVTFHLGSAQPVNWTFARELLVEGVFRPSGHGDVRIWPAKAGGRGVICLALRSPDGSALLEAAATPVTVWLESTLRAVPPGTEGDHVSLDAGLSELLAPTAGDELWPRGPWPFGEAPEG